MAKIESMVPMAVCDAGPLIHLDQLDCLELLEDFRNVLVPEAVFEEVLDADRGSDYDFAGGFGSLKHQNSMANENSSFSTGANGGNRVRKEMTYSCLSITSSRMFAFFVL
jgi:hypothetical protein